MPRPRFDAAGLGGSEPWGMGSRVRIPPSRPLDLNHLRRFERVIPPTLCPRLCPRWGRKGRQRRAGFCLERESVRSPKVFWNR